MTEAITLRQFFGDGERSFALTDNMIAELEHLTGSGIGALYLKIVASQFALSELVEILRLGLIGGGCHPEEAARLVKAYANDRPITETFPLALSIMDARYSGASKAAQ